jgi:hypothetical protein
LSLGDGMQGAGTILGVSQYVRSDRGKCSVVGDNLRITGNQGLIAVCIEIIAGQRREIVRNLCEISAIESHFNGSGRLRWIGLIASCAVEPNHSGHLRFCVVHKYES